jgi:hypothetical protein
MCQNDVCGKASDCLRYMAVPSDRQGYFEFQNICKEPAYQYYLPVGNDKVRGGGSPR